MTNHEIISILSQWNFWQKKVDTGLARPKYVQNLLKQKDQKEVSVITGVRRCGKSTALLQALEEIIDNGTPSQNILYINFEEPAFAADLDLKFLLQIYDAYREKFLPKGKIYMALDEIHMVPQWERFVRGVYDRGDNVKFYITDSSSHLLSKEYGHTLTGRSYSNVIYPLSFQEFLYFKKQDNLLDESKINTNSVQLRHAFLEYLEFGGFPQTTLTADKRTKTQLLKEYYSAIIEKDIAGRYKVRDSRLLKEFCLLAMTQNGLPMSGYSAQKAQDIAQPTANKFLSYLDEVFLMLPAGFFSYSLSQQQKRPKKLYSIDTGIYNAVSFKFSENIGRVFENAVFLALKRSGEEVFYWQGKRETDFVVRQGRSVKKLINACWNLNEENKSREVEGLVESMEKFKLKEARIIT
ncbi:MAG: ATP-binding protein, partial [Candidatus Moranbacteria bacterium]|nr:ATP-binding protein [Candidatus Moranbacteria bacterium]